MSALLEAIAALLVVGGLLAMTVAVFGVLRMRDPYLRLHAAANTAVPATLAILAASIGTGDGALIRRALLAAAFLLLTAPVSAHALARTIRTAGEHGPGEADEAPTPEEVGQG